MSENFEKVMALSDLKEGGMRDCVINGREVVVCRTKDGLYALDNICTHAHARMSEGRLRGVRLICPLHGASFDVRDGKALGAPASRPLACHAVRLTDDMVEVSLAAAVERPLTL